MLNVTALFHSGLWTASEQPEDSEARQTHDRPHSRVHEEGFDDCLQFTSSQLYVGRAQNAFVLPSDIREWLP
jgi:hypothetical protein